MNIFELTTVLSISTGALGAASVCHSSLAATIGAVAIGGALGFGSYWLSVSPGLLTLMLAPGKGLTDSRQANVGAFLLLAGSMTAPVTSFLVVRALAAAAIPLLGT